MALADDRNHHAFNNGLFANDDPGDVFDDLFSELADLFGLHGNLLGTDCTTGTIWRHATAHGTSMFIRIPEPSYQIGHAKKTSGPGRKANEGLRELK
jgi:hypothetical protein